MIEIAGWIKLHRCLFEKAIWTTSTPVQKTILITLLSMANHAEKEWEWKGERYKVKPGQFVTSLKSIAEKCGDGVSIRNVRTALERFEKYEFLTNESTNRNRLITITNWGFYQSKEEEPTKQLTSNRQATDKQLTTNKNDKNNKNDKKENKPPYPLSEFGFSAEMESQIITWLEYKKEKKDTYTKTGFRSLLRKIKKQSDQHGEQAIISLIEESMSNNWKGIIWDNVGKVKSGTVSKSTNPFDEILRKELENEQSRNNSTYEDNQGLLPYVLPERRT